jgi:flagellar biosynthesis/type III secretory pathway protein FliH
MHELACESANVPVDGQVPACERCAARAPEDDGIDPRLIRAAAIPLAAAACARALRYAIDRNPRLIVRFVDDALAAAGAAARRAKIRMTPDCIAAFDPERAHAVTADEELGPGDVYIDTPAGAIGALLDERADLLVRAAAG